MPRRGSRRRGGLPHHGISASTQGLPAFGRWVPESRFVSLLLDRDEKSLHFSVQQIQKSWMLSFPFIPACRRANSLWCPSLLCSSVLRNAAFQFVRAVVATHHRNVLFPSSRSWQPEIQASAAWSPQKEGSVSRLSPCLVDSFLVLVRPHRPPSVPVCV